MSFEDERQAIEARLAANYSAVPIKYENLPFEQPSESAWVALTILTGAGAQVTIGTTRAVQRYAGVIQVDIFVPEDTGTKTARQMADTIEAIFRNVQFSTGNSGTITTRTPSLMSLGTEDGWHHLVLSTAYHRDKNA